MTQEQEKTLQDANKVNELFKELKGILYEERTRRLPMSEEAAYKNSQRKEAILSKANSYGVNLRQYL